MPPGYQPGGSTPLSGGVPWESPSGGLLGRWWATMTSANFKGKEFFAAVAQGSDPMPAVLFSTVTMTIGGAIMGLLYAMGIMLFGAAIIAAFGASSLGPSFAGFGVGMAVMVFISATITGAVGGFVGPWVWGGIHHLCLMLFGGVGAGREYGHTVRAHAYASAAPYLFVPAIILPGVGGLVVLVFFIINHIHAYDEMHRCGGGKAFGAIALPFGICCCLYFAFLMLAGLAGNL